MMMMAVVLAAVTLGMADDDSEPIWTIENGVLTGADLNGCADVAIPDGVTSIGDVAFFTQLSLTSVTMPNSVTNIGNEAFQDCENLMSVTLGNGVTSIGQAAFNGCTSLTSVDTPDSVTSMGYGAFVGCRSLESVTIGKGVTHIGDMAFYGCPKLKSVTMAGDCPAVGESAFDEIDSTCVVHLPRGNTTYVVTDGKWQGMTVEYYGRAHDVIFNANGGTLTAETLTATVADGEVLGLLPTPTRGGFAFSGWFTAIIGGKPVTPETVVTEDMTVYARWTAAWTVTFNANSGKLKGEDGEVSTLKVPKAKGKAVGTLPTPTRAGYAFKGWFTKKSGGTKITTKTKVTKNVTWYAQWTVRKYKVAVTKAGKGTVSGAGSKAYQSKATLKAKAASGYVFQGWYKTAEGEDDALVSQKATYSFKVPLDGVTLKARFITKAEDKAGIGMEFGGRRVRGDGGRGRRAGAARPAGGDEHVRRDDDVASVGGGADARERVGDGPTEGHEVRRQEKGRDRRSVRRQQVGNDEGHGKVRRGEPDMEREVAHGGVARLCARNLQRMDGHPLG